MAAIRQNSNVLVVLSGKCLYTFRNGEKGKLEIPDVPIIEDKAVKKKDNRKDGLEKTNKNWILASTFSKSGSFFAICDDQKQLHVYRTSPKWELLSTRSVPRRGTAVIFTHSEMHIIIADRSGDVYRFPLDDSGKEAELLLGHLSMLLNVIVTRDDRYIVTCDRDEKIRISQYPNAYNIHTFCLKHTEFVSQLLYIDKYDCLLSGSGDGTICSWNMNGNLQHCISCARKLCHTPSQGQRSTESTNGEADTEVRGHLEEQQAAAVKKMVYDGHLSILAIIFFNLHSVCFYTLSQTNSTVQLQELNHTVDISCDKEFWDVSFDTEHRLWLLQASEAKTVHVFSCSVSGTQLQLTDASRDEDISEVVDFLNSDWSFFSESLSAPSLYTLLQKTKVDNMKEYMERKNERMSGKKLKQGGVNEERWSEPEEKKMKVS